MARRWPRYVIADRYEETQCGQCGCCLYVGDTVFLAVLGDDGSPWAACGDVCADRLAAHDADGGR